MSGANTFKHKGTTITTVGFLILKSSYKEPSKQERRVLNMQKPVHDSSVHSDQVRLDWLLVRHGLSNLMKYLTNEWGKPSNRT